jgi:hypothetical protein
LGECKLVQLLWKSVWGFLKKLKIELPYDPAILLLGIYPNECKSAYNRDRCTHVFIVALFTVAKLWNQPRCPPSGESMKKMWSLHTMEYYSAKEEWNYIICREMDGTGDHHVKWNKPDWERQILHVLSHMWNLDLRGEKWMTWM